MKCSDSLMSCSACKIGKSTQSPHAKSASHDWVTEPLQVVTTDLRGPISPAALLGNCKHIAKFTVVYFLKNKSSSSIVVVVVHLTLTDPLRFQPWSQDRRNQTKSNRKSEISSESRQKRTDKKVASKGHHRDKIENTNKNTQTVETN